MSANAALDSRRSVGGRAHRRCLPCAASLPACRAAPIGRCLDGFPPGRAFKHRRSRLRRAVLSAAALPETSSARAPNPRLGGFGGFKGARARRAHTRRRRRRRCAAQDGELCDENGELGPGEFENVMRQQAPPAPQSPAPSNAPQTPQLHNRIRPAFRSLGRVRGGDAAAGAVQSADAFTSQTPASLKRPHLALHLALWRGSST